MSQTKKVLLAAGLHVSRNGRYKSCRLKVVQTLLGIFEHLMVALKLIEFLSRIIYFVLKACVGGMNVRDKNKKQDRNNPLLLLLLYKSRRVAVPRFASYVRVNKS